MALQKFNILVHNFFKNNCEIVSFLLEYRIYYIYSLFLNTHKTNLKEYAV